MPDVLIAATVDARVLRFYWFETKARTQRQNCLDASICIF